MPDVTDHRSTGSAMPPAVFWLGYGGLIPFVFGAVAAGIGGGYASQFNHALLAYGAVILSFVGALHWGFAMTIDDLPERRRNSVFLWSIVPALVAWLALSLAATPAAILMVLGYLAQYRQDARLAGMTALPVWYLPLRLRLTLVACICLAVGGAVGQR